MAVRFDPYYSWLGIPPKQQPPTYYRLLGIDLFEANPDVISNAADKQMLHVRSFRTGENSALSQKILIEIATARVCLLNADKKSQYDQMLRAAVQQAMQERTQNAVQQPAPHAPRRKLDKRKVHGGIPRFSEFFDIYVSRKNVAIMLDVFFGWLDSNCLAKEYSFLVVLGETHEHTNHS